MTEKETKIKDVILSYCQGRYHAEFDMDILPEMVSKIAALKNLPSSQPSIDSHFAFAKYLKDYDYVDNGSEGDEYLHDQGRFNEKEIYDRWRDSL